MLYCDFDILMLLKRCDMTRKTLWHCMYKSNIKARSHNHCYRWKAICIT